VYQVPPDPPTANTPARTDILVANDLAFALYDGILDLELTGESDRLMGSTHALLPGRRSSGYIHILAAMIKTTRSTPGASGSRGYGRGSTDSDRIPAGGRC
jgi:hypothetical protein